MSRKRSHRIWAQPQTNRDLLVPAASNDCATSCGCVAARIRFNDRNVAHSAFSVSFRRGGEPATLSNRSTSATIRSKVVTICTESASGQEQLQSGTSLREVSRMSKTYAAERRATVAVSDAFLNAVVDLRLKASTGLSACRVANQYPPCLAAATFAGSDDLTCY